MLLATHISMHQQDWATDFYTTLAKFEVTYTVLSTLVSNTMTVGSAPNQRLLHFTEGVDCKKCLEMHVKTGFDRTGP